MLYSEIIAVCSQIHTKHINTLCGQNVDIFGLYTAQYDALSLTFRRTDVTSVCCNVTPYRLLEVYNIFQETQFLYPQDKTHFSVLQMYAAGTSNKPKVPTHQPA